MESWIQALIGAALGPIRALAQAAADRIRAVYDAFTAALTRVRAGFRYWLDRAYIWATATIRHALVVAGFLRWLLLVELPRRAGRILADATRWAADRIAALRDLLRAELIAARTWLTARIHEALAGIIALRNWVLDRIAELRLSVRRLLDRVFGELGSPERVVAWILAPLIGALVRWWWDNVEALAELAWRRRRQIEARALSVTESIIDRIL